jgi:PAS domain S-box-containing protein
MTSPSNPDTGTGSFPEAHVYRLALESLPDTAFVATRDGRFQWVSPNVAELLGRDAATVRETETVASLFGPDLVAPLAPSEDRLDDQPAAVTDADGVERRLLVTVRQVTPGRDTADHAEPAGASGDEDEGGDQDEDDRAALLYACRDVTEVERLERELDETLDRITDGFIELDTEFRIARANDHAVELFDIPRSALVGSRLWEFSPDPESTESFSAFPEALRTGEPVSYETYFEPQDRWYEARAYPSETGLSVYFRDVSTRVERMRSREESESRFRALFEGTLDALVLADDDGRYLDVNPAACELYGLPREKLLGKTAGDFAPSGFDFETAWESFLDVGSMRGEFELVRPDGEVRITDFAARANIRPGEHLSVLRDITERVERERQLEIQRDELAHLAHINRLVSEVNRAIVGADTRTEVLSDVCQRLVAADVYRHAIVATETTGGRFEVTAAAGLSATAAAAVVGTFERELTTAARRVTSVIAPPPADLLDAQSAPEGVDVRVFGCFPLAYAGMVHGVLLVGADRTDGSPVLVGGEQHILDDLGETVGKAITAVTARRLLHVDEVVSLEFTVADADDVFNELSRALSATVTVTTLVPLSDGRHTCYLTVTEPEGARDGWDHDEVRRTVEAVDGVDGCRVVSANDTLRLEVRVADSSPALVLERQGTHVRTLSSADGRGRLVVELPTESDVRRLVDRVSDDYPETTLVRKLQERRSTGPNGAIGERVADAGGEGVRPLTEKQLAALRAARAGGYYDWPRRGSTAQELAGALGVAPATYHQHLRAAEGKLVDAFFDD